MENESFVQTYLYTMNPNDSYKGGAIYRDLDYVVTGIHVIIDMHVYLFFKNN